MRIELKSVSYIYGRDTAYETKALDNINLNIGEGEFIGVIGHTGSGKSTLIEHLNGLVRPTYGTVLCDGENIWDEGYDIRSLRTRVGLVFQYPENQLFEVSVIKDVMFGPMNKGLDEEESQKRALEALRLVGMKEKYFEVSPFELSGGLKRRAAIAGVLAMDPEVLMLDEPTAGLDPSGRDAILNQISHLQKERNISVILVSHSMEDVARYATRIIVIDEGKLAYDGTPKEVFRSYKELEKIGLSAPRITYVMHELASRGLPADVDATTVDEAKESIISAFSKKNETGEL